MIKTILADESTNPAGLNAETAWDVVRKAWHIVKQEVAKPVIKAALGGVVCGIATGIALYNGHREIALYTGALAAVLAAQTKNSTVRAVEKLKAMPAPKL